MASANGRLTKSELTDVQGVKLSKRTAEAWNLMRAAAAKDGVGIWPALPAGGYRDFFVQGDMKKRPKLYGLSTKNTVNLASPGYSNHGLGIAVDVGSFPAARDLNAYGSAGVKRRVWLLANAAEFGFRRPFGESDPNHFIHNGKAVITPAAPKPPATPKPIIVPAVTPKPTPTLTGDPMKNWACVLHRNEKKQEQWYLVSNDHHLKISKGARSEFAKILDGGEDTVVGDETMAAILEMNRLNRGE